jgi:hypothetical protein
VILGSQSQIAADPKSQIVGYHGGLHRSWTVSGGAAGSQSAEEKAGEDDVLVALEEFAGKGK